MSIIESKNLYRWKATLLFSAFFSLATVRIGGILCFYFKSWCLRILYRFLLLVGTVAILTVVLQKSSKETPVDDLGILNRVCGGWLISLVIGYVFLWVTMALLATCKLRQHMKS